MKHLSLAAFSLPFMIIAATPASAFVYVSGSVSVANSNGGLQTYNSQGGSGSISFDIARFLRLGYTHKQEIQQSKGFIGAADGDCADIDHLDSCVTYDSKTHVISNSVDLTVALYQGEVFMSFILGGIIVKSYDTVTTKDGVRSEIHTPPSPGPNGGVGLGMRLNRDFSLRITYTVSPGKILKDPATKKVDSVWDRETDFGLTYQL